MVYDDKPREEPENPDAGSAETSENPDERRAMETFERSKDELKNANIESSMQLLETLNRAIDRGDKKKMLDLMWQFDQSEFMIFIRKWWDRQFAFAQKMAYNYDNFPIFQHLVRMGFLELKGVSEADLQKMEHGKTVARKWIINILSVVFAELRPFKPLIDLSLKMEEKQKDFGKTSRSYLAERRVEEEQKAAAKDHHKKAA